MATYPDVLQYLDNLELFGIKLGLENITALCGLLGNPQLQYKTIHVAGTNGKGSVAAMCARILSEAGYRVGMYTSPHLQTFRERIQVNGTLITQEETVEAFDTVKKASDSIEAEGRKPTYFEFTTAMAFLHFAEKKCEFAVIEVGMGGRLDATNIVKPEVAVITNIALDHTQYLGDTKEKIAMEKAGIIKEKVPVIIGEKDEKIRKLLLNACKEKNSEAVAVTNDYNGKIFLQGEHQKSNAAIAEAAIQVLVKQGVKISKEAIVKGIATAKWPGRLEKMQSNPEVILDSAHNPAGAETTAAYIRRLGKEVIIVIGVSDDKDSAGIMKLLAPLAKKVIVTKAKHRGTDCAILKKEALRYCMDVEAVDDVKAAVSKAMNDTAKAVIVAGSIFVAGEARELWQKQN